MAGFGTSGSLLAGAALLFLLASAFVAFQGWPQVNQQSSPVSVAIPRVDLSSGSHAARVLSAAAGARSGGAAGSRGHAGAGVTGASRGHSRFVTGTNHGQVSTVVKNPGSTHSPGSTPNPNPNPTSSCTVACTGTPGGSTVGKVRRTVSSVTTSGNTTVGNTVTTIHNLLPKSSNGVSHTVTHVGHTVTHVVSTTKNTVGGVTGGLP